MGEETSREGRPRSSKPIEKKSKIVRRGEEKERKRWTAERSALIRAMTAINTTIVGVGGGKSRTAGVITVVKGMDIMEVLAMTGTMQCKDFVKAQGRQRSTGEGRGEGRIMATEVDALPIDTLAMVTRLLHQNNQ